MSVNAQKADEGITVWDKSWSMINSTSASIDERCLRYFWDICSSALYNRLHSKGGFLKKGCRIWTPQHWSETLCFSWKKCLVEQCFEFCSNCPEFRCLIRNTASFLQRVTVRFQLGLGAISIYFHKWYGMRQFTVCQHAAVWYERIWKIAQAAAVSITISVFIAFNMYIVSLDNIKQDEKLKTQIQIENTKMHKLSKVLVF